jgi:hypothetical protein
MKTLSQKKRFKHFEFEIADSGLVKKVIHKNGESKFTIPFEKISNNQSIITYQQKSALWIGLSLSALSLLLFWASFNKKNEIEPFASLIWLVIGGGLLGYYFFGKEEKLLLYMTDNQSIEFIADMPSKEEVAEFIQKLSAERNLSLVSKYGRPSRFMDYSPQFDNLNWLLNAGVISKAEYDEKIVTLNSIFKIASSEKAQIGFLPGE